MSKKVFVQKEIKVAVGTGTWVIAAVIPKYLSQRLRTFLSQGHVCVIDDYEEEAVRLESRNGKTFVFIKRKGRNEIPTIMSEDCVQNIINELNNRIVSREEYDKY